MTLLNIKIAADARIVCVTKQTSDLCGIGEGFATLQHSEQLTAIPQEGYGIDKKTTGTAPTVVASKTKSFRRSSEASDSLVKSKLITISVEAIKLLNSDPNGTFRIRLEIADEFPQEANDTIKRGVCTNATSLGFKS